MKIAIHSDRPDLHNSGSLIIAAMQMPDIEIVSPARAELVINVDSIHNVGLKRGPITAYYEVDDYLHLAKNKEFYDVDLLYITTKSLLPIYPEGARWLPPAMEPTIHLNWPIFEQTYDLVFIGALDGNDAYLFRKEVINALNEKFNMLVTTCQPQD